MEWHFGVPQKPWLKMGMLASNGGESSILTSHGRWSQAVHPCFVIWAMHSISCQPRWLDSASLSGPVLSASLSSDLLPSLISLPCGCLLETRLYPHGLPLFSPRQDLASPSASRGKQSSTGQKSILIIKQQTAPGEVPGVTFNSEVSLR